MTEVIYKHYKKGGQYIIINAGEMQIDDVWHECVIYQDINSKKIYVREAIDFENKFSAQKNESEVNFIKNRRKNKIEYE